jgi:hypothetical protein
MPSSSEVKEFQTQRSSRACLENADTSSVFEKKFAIFYETRRFITAFTRAHH